VEYRNLGQTGLKVSRLFFGGSHIGEIIDEDQARKLIHKAWDVGINTFYTADKYNNGAGQDIIGKIIKPRRDDINLLIKTGYRVGTAEVPVSDSERLASHFEKGTIDHNEMWRKGVSPNSRGLSRKRIMMGVERSLKRLGTDYIDVYVAHYFDKSTPVDETLQAFDDLIRQGKVRYIGCSQTAAWQLYQALWTSEVKGLARYQSQQVRFNMIERANRAEQMEAAAAAGVSILAFSSLAGGLLTGAYDRNSAIADGMGFRRLYTEMYWSDSTFDMLDRLRPIAAAGGRSLGELAQAWTLAQAPVTALQIGPNEPEEFDEQVRAAERPLTASEAEAIDEVLADFP
jgi:aryl-alcohol dehydrogenase-like predicted oxidoreductase